MFRLRKNSVLLEAFWPILMLTIYCSNINGLFFFLESTTNLGRLGTKNSVFVSM